jgi:coproporphyrinogen III oxidase-like Fe-S oxidoreductase
MLDLRINAEHPLIKFNRQLPVFNWHYPFDREEDRTEDRLTPYLSFPKMQVRRRSVYIHIPFCETICNFCPFSHDMYRPGSGVAEYLRALIGEINLKKDFIGRCKVDAIFVGGGTPSLLSPGEIELLGEAIHRNFDLEGLKEFTFEVEVKSASQDKLQAMRSIGVNRVSFGAQTFSPKYRALYHLDASQRQITDTAALLNSLFPYTNVDLLYGTAGQSADELRADVEAAIRLQTTTIDVYPINNLTAPRGMHLATARAGLDVLPESTRVQFRILLGRLFQDLGYRPISGYGFAVAGNARTNPVDPVQHQPNFLYHDMVYGYQDDEIIGYGSSAISQTPGFNMYNFARRKAYIDEVLNNHALPHLTFGPIPAPERGIVSFPYRGVLEKPRVAWDRVPDETWEALQEAIAAELVLDQGDRYVLTEAGLLFYVNLMYYLMPSPGKRCVSDQIERQERSGRTTGNTDLTEWACSTLPLVAISRPAGAQARSGGGRSALVD